MRKNYIFSTLFALISLFTFAQQEYLNGILVLNEGNIGTDSGAVSFISQDNQVSNNIFRQANSNAILGDVAQSMSFYNDVAVIVLNASNTIKIVNKKTFQLVENGIIDTGLINPRYVSFYDNKAYVTCWGNGGNPDDDYVAVINMDTYQIESTISFPEGIEKIKTINGKLYIAHQGGYGTGNTISIYNIESATTHTVTVGDVPSELIEHEGYLYILCAGLPYWHPSGTTVSSIYRIQLSDDSMAGEFYFPTGITANHMAYHENTLYITMGEKIGFLNIEDPNLNDFNFITTPVTDFMGIYGLDIIDDKIYVADANGYSASGFAHIYSLEGELLHTHIVGSIPNHFYKSAEGEMGVDDRSIASINIYPNPTAEKFYLNTNDTVQVSIYDMTGKLVKKAINSNNGILISELQKGIYMVEISKDNQKQVTKLVIQ